MRQQPRKAWPRPRNGRGHLLTRRTGQVDGGRTHPLFIALAHRAVDQPRTADFRHRSLTRRLLVLHQLHLTDFHRRLGGRLVDAGQQLPHLLAHDGPALDRREATDQAHLFRFTAHFVPRHPEAIRVAQIALAVVLFKLFGREAVLTVGARVVWIGPRLVEGIDDERARHLHGLAAGAVVKHQPAAEAAHRGLAIGAAHRIGPKGDDSQGPAKLAGAPEERRQIFLHAEIGNLRAAGRGGEQADDNEVQEFHAGSGFGVQGSGFGVRGSGFRVRGSTQAYGSSNF